MGFAANAWSAYWALLRTPLPKRRLKLLFKTLKYLHHRPLRLLKLFYIACLRGISQIFLQRNATTGLFILIGLFIQSWAWGVASLLGVITGTALGYRWDKSHTVWRNGIFGFNGALAGLGAVVFWGIQPESFLLAMIAAAAAAYITRLWIKHLKFAFYTAPFVIVTWALAYFAPAAQKAPVVAELSQWRSITDGLLRGLSQVVFVDHLLAALFICIALAVAGLRVVSTALLVSLVSLAFGALLNLPASSAALGLFGFNAVLTVEALHQRIEYHWWVPLAAVLATLALTLAFNLLGWVTLTAPFILSTWFLQWLLERLNTNSRPIEPHTPSSL